MNRTDLIDALEALDARLTAPVDLLVIGGAAMILHFQAARATRDIDVIMLRGDLPLLRAAADGVADELGLPTDWLSDAAKGFADILPADFYRRIEPLPFVLHHLRLYALGRPDQAAMKIIALREQDLEDLELLVPDLTDADKDTLIRIADEVSRFRPDWAQKIVNFMEEHGWTTD